MQVIAQQGDTLDLVCHRHLGRTDIVETVLSANPGLAKLGAVLPMGTAIVLPDSTPAQTTKKLVQLWD